MAGIRLSKVMADRGLCSRREADRLIRQGLVEVDGKVVSELGTRIDPSVQIALAPQALRARQNLVTVLLNKPPGYVSTQPEKGYPDARNLICATNRHCRPGSIERQAPRRASLHVAGRLDIDSSGLLVLTEDGVGLVLIAHRDGLAPVIADGRGEVVGEHAVGVAGIASRTQAKQFFTGIVRDR